MITSKNLHEEVKDFESIIEKLNKDDRSFEAALLKSQCLTLKLLLNIRQNQVNDLNANNVNLIKSKNRE